MTISKLKKLIEDYNPHFFDRETMKFFGDTVKNYGIRNAGDYWELYRKRPVKNGNKSSAFFDKITGRRVLK